MKSSPLAALVALVLALVLFWFAAQGYNVVRWRIRYMMPAFISGVLVGVVSTLVLVGRR
ncbi:hypothetical protein EDD41_0469 [Luteococcus japonicus]|uniref:Uncharacterized protein n=1 Tax=Luteococcus japonicus TaxID=33984 RepID=A0A3N1ZQZ9_9ACTN|nr:MULTISPECIES: hypothetical protein [Luteococcus]MDN5563329.1 hypothetical protein [Luteococcus sp.]ROR53329.1 hypothetical protein EDD41_0469 [Luteococcus japonicus]